MDPKKELLAELLLQWEELRERGQDTPATELAKEHPELIEELARRIQALKSISWLDKPLDDDPPGDCPQGSPPHTARTLAGRYRLDELIAEGGFAQVYRAYDSELQRTVAIKIPKPSRLDSKEAFQAEARRVARLKHENIVPVHDVGVENDTCFIITEYVEGGSLADRMAKGRPTREEAIRWMCGTADALEYAHLHGVIHLDIKPANILIDANGRAKLADFGIARSALKTGAFAPSLGTLRYMSPEQLEGKPADHRSDIYSLGVVLHEVLTGRIPYSSGEPNVLRKEIVQGRAAPGNKGLPPALKAICEKALRKSPYQRHASAAQLAAELTRAGHTAIKTPWRLVGIGAILTGLAVGTGLALQKTPSESSWPRATNASPASSFEYAMEAEGVVIRRHIGGGSSVIIPHTIDGKTVVGVGSDAFKGCDKLVAVTLPPTIVRIGNMSFYGCTHLRSIALPPQLASIGFNAFEFGSRLEAMHIPASVASIGAVCFVNCRSMKNITVDEANQDFASVDGVLYDKDVTTLITCPAGKRGEVRVPSTVTTILGWSFLGCDKLKLIVIPESVTDIQEHAFDGCSATQTRR